MSQRIESISVLRGNGGTRLSDGDSFISVHAAGKSGWYGPVSVGIGRYVEAVLAKAVIGHLITDHENLLAVMKEAIANDSTEVASWAVGAVDCATWDVHSQTQSVTVSNLLAESPRAVVPLYASWLRFDLSSPTALSVSEDVRRKGWCFTKWGLRTTSRSSTVAEGRRLVTTAQSFVKGIGCKAAFDAVFTWDVDILELFVSMIDPTDIVWLEDPLPDHHNETYRSLAMNVPIALGERLFVQEDATALFDLPLRALTIDVVACGGLTRAVDLVMAASSRGIAVYPHGRSFVPGLHLAAAFPEAVPAVEYRLQWEAARQQWYMHPWLPVNGLITIPNLPGLGTAPRKG